MVTWHFGPTINVNILPGLSINEVVTFVTQRR